MAVMTKNELIKKMLLDIAKEEKTHMGEFQTLLLKEDDEQLKELESEDPKTCTFIYRFIKRKLNLLPLT